MLRVMYSDDKLLTIGYIGIVNAEVGDALFDGFFKGTIDYLNGEKRIYEGEGHTIFINEKCLMNGEFAGLVKFKVYPNETDIPEFERRTLDYLVQQDKQATGI